MANNPNVVDLSRAFPHLPFVDRLIEVGVERGEVLPPDTKHRSKLRRVLAEEAARWEAQYADRPTRR